MRARTTTAILVVGVLLCLASGGCPRGRPLTSGVQVGRVMGVVPYSMSDQWGEQPESAFLCMSDPDCEVVTVRDCCSACSTTWLAVNHPAARAIERHHEVNPCPGTVTGCPDVECDDSRPAPVPPEARCLSQRCALVAE